MFQYIVLLGASLNVAGILFYLKETVRGKTKPNRVSWALWSVAPLIATAAGLSAGIRLAVIPVFISGFVPLMVFIASFANKKSYWKLSSFDYLCGACSVLALILWAITKEPLVAIVFAILSDGFAAIPTIIKSWTHPETESASAYATGLISACSTFFALKTFSAAEISFPIYLVVVNSILTIVIFWSRHRKHTFSK
jgi:hypothetical protein